MKFSFNRSSVDPSATPDELFAHYSLLAFDEGRTALVGGTIKSWLFLPKLSFCRNSTRISRAWVASESSEPRSLFDGVPSRAAEATFRALVFVLRPFTSTDFASEYATLVTGTTGSHQRVKGETVLQVKLAVPPLGLVERFWAIAHPVFRRINANITESSNLAVIREALLPQLLSGELATG